MRYAKEAVTAAGTLALAAAIGFVMQSTESAKYRYGARPAPEAAIAPSNSDLSSDATSRPHPNLASVISRIELTAAPGRFGRAPADDRATSTNCDIRVTAKTHPGALVELMMDAPCLPNERLTVHHNGLMFTETTNAMGQMRTEVPALKRQAVFILAFANGDGAVVQSLVEGIGAYGRTALQWRGDAGFELHAREFGAEYGESGHIWSGLAETVGDALGDDHGFMMRLGNADVAEPLLAEVYTYPIAYSDTRGTIDLTVETQVNEANCGLDVEAQAIEMMGTQLRQSDLTLSVPDCEAVGSFLVLNNLISDMQVVTSE